MFKIIFRYLSINFIPPFLMSTLFFVVFLLTFQLITITKLVINKGVAVAIIVELIGSTSISFLPMSIPLSALFSSIYCLTRMSADSEIMVMRAIGLSKLKLFFPFLVMGIVIAMVVFALNLNLVPNANKDFKRIITILTSKGILSDIKPQQFYTDIPYVTLFANEVKNKGNYLKEVYIHIADSDDEEEKIIMAKEGEFIKNNENKFGAANIKLNLKNGNLINVHKDKNDLEKIIFNEYEFPVTTAQIQTEFGSKDSTKTSKELWKILKESPEKRAKVMSPKDFNRTQLEFWSRINNPIVCLIFILLGFSLGIQKSRGKSSTNSLLIILILAIYYGLFFGLVSIARSGKIPTTVAVFLPTFLLGVVSVRLFQKLEWVA
ncbi:MAG: LptF/LptG family permease [Bacteriovoracaceae bacterium]